MVPGALGKERAAMKDRCIIDDRERFPAARGAGCSLQASRVLGRVGSSLWQGGGSAAHQIDEVPLR
jgi:hypothetical protein